VTLTFDLPKGDRFIPLVRVPRMLGM